MIIKDYYEFVIVNGIHIQYIILPSILKVISLEMVTLGINY
jgi:hypothetical protein